MILSCDFNNLTQLGTDNNGLEATQNQIDHIAISRKWPASLLDVRNKHVANVASDHQLLIANIRLIIISIKQFEERKKFDVSKLSGQAI